MNDRGRFVLNLLSQLAVLLSQFIISFVLTPIVLTKLGDEAYGFVGLVNNFVSYAAIITAALNSMAGRYITVSYHEGDKKETTEYMSSVFFSNCFMAFVVMIGAILLALYVDRFVSVSPALVEDLRLTVIIAFLNAAIGLLIVVMGVAAFIKNDLYLNSVAQLIGSVLRVVTLFLLFWFAAPHMWYFSVAGLISTIVMGSIQFSVTKRLIPEVRISLKCFNARKVVELLHTGVWASLQNVNVLIQTGLDLIVANLFLGGTAMGLLSIAKTVPMALTTLSGSIANLFYPKMAQAYAESNKELLVSRFAFSMRFTSGFMIVPLAGLIGFGMSFYRLWLPGRNEAELVLIQVLSVLTVMSLMASALVEPLYYANTLTTKIKGSVLIAFVFSLLTVVIEFSLLLFTDVNKLIVIAGVSSILMFVRHAIIQPVYCAMVLHVPASSFFKPLIQELLVLMAVVAAYLIFDHIMPAKTWTLLIIDGLLGCIVGYLFVFVTLFKKEERRTLLKVVSGYLSRGRE